MATEDREKALEAALAQIDKQYGKGSVMRLGEEVRAPIEVIPTGSIALDVALGIGGSASRPGGGNLRSRVQWQDDCGSARDRQRPSRGASAHSSMPSTRWILSMQDVWAWTLTHFWSANQTMANRPWRSPTC